MCCAIVRSKHLFSVLLLPVTVLTKSFPCCGDCHQTRSFEHLAGLIRKDAAGSVYSCCDWSYSWNEYCSGVASCDLSFNGSCASGNLDQCTVSEESACCCAAISTESASCPNLQCGHTVPCDPTCMKDRTIIVPAECITDFSESTPRASESQISCMYEHNSSMQPWMAWAAALATPLLFGLVAEFACQLLKIPKRSSRVAALSATLILFVLATIPAATMPYPFTCSLVSFQHGDEQLYPLCFLGASGSVTGLAVSLAWVATNKQNSLSKRAVAYFVFACLGGFLGLTGSLLISCGYNYNLGSKYLLAWGVVQFLTNLILQELLVERVRLMAGKGTKHLRRALILEVIAAIVLLLLLMISVPVNGINKLDKAMQAGLLWAVVAATCFFLMMDFVFSCVACMSFWSSLKDTGSEPVPAGGLRQQQDIDVVKVLKINFVVVFLSVFTTTLYYAALLNVFSQFGDRTTLASAFVFLSWLCDTISNDVCIVLVGFGASASAFESVGNNKGPPAVATVLGNAA